MGPKVGMIVRVNHPEVNPKTEWIIHEVVDTDDRGRKFYHLKSNGELVQWMMLPSFVDYEVRDNTMPPTLTADISPIRYTGNRQDREFVNRIVKGTYCTTLKIPETEYRLTERAMRSWEKQIKNERDRNVGLFKWDLMVALGRHPENKPYAQSQAQIWPDIDVAIKRYQEMAGKELDFSDWMTFLGIYGSYVKLIEG